MNYGYAIEKQSLIIIKDTVNSSQEIRFDKSKIKENINDITLKFNFQPKPVILLLFGQTCPH